MLFYLRLFSGPERAWTAPGTPVGAICLMQAYFTLISAQNPDFFRTNSFNSGRVFALSSAITHTMRHLRKIRPGSPEVINNLLTTRLFRLRRNTDQFSRGTAIFQMEKTIFLTKKMRNASWQKAGYEVCANGNLSKVFWLLLFRDLTTPRFDL